MRRLGAGRQYGRAVLAAGAALCAFAALPGQASAAGTPNPYAFVDGAQTIAGATSNTDAVRLDAGRTYRSSIKAGGKLYYRLELNSKDTAYVSATVVPRLGTKVAYGDGIKVSVEDGNSNECSYEDTQFGSSESPHPVAAMASRRIDPGMTQCQTAGTYYAVVERTSDPGSSQDAWDLELHVASEPPLKNAGSTTPPESWNSASPAPPSGEPKRRQGGSSFGSAPGLTQGVWQDDIKPGQTLFYRVPVDWGQQLHAVAELGSSSGDGFVSTALEMSVYNPVRGFVDDTDTAYDGGQKSAVLDPLPPVAYKNRYATDDSVGGMRFAGWYYLAVHLNPKVGESFGKGAHGLTLRVKVSGAAQPGPAYAGSARPADEFSVSGKDKEAAASGETVSDTARGETMQLVAVSGIGTGAALVLVLGLWTLLARRRAAAEAGAAPVPGPADHADAGAPTQYDPPRGW